MLKKLLLPVLCLSLLAGCMHNEKYALKQANDLYLKEMPFPTFSEGSYGRTINHNNEELFIKLTNIDSEECIEFLNYNLDSNEITWDEITLIEPELAKETVLYQEKKSAYGNIENYCEQAENPTISLRLTKNSLIYKEAKKTIEDELAAQTLADKEEQELFFSIEAHNMFWENREYFPKEEKVASREHYFEYRNDKKEKENRIRLHLTYTDMSKGFCVQMLKTHVTEDYNGSGVSTFQNGNRYWETIHLNGEELTLGYKRYNKENLCHTLNKMEMIIFKEYEEPSEGWFNNNEEQETVEGEN